MANRILHFDLPPPSVEEFCTYLQHGNQAQHQSVLHGEQRVIAAWPQVWPRVVGLGVGFHRKFQTLKVDKEDRNTLYWFPPVGHRDRHRAWASNRAWEMALRCYATAEIFGQQELGLELLSAAVGPGFGPMWAEWVASANVPDSEDVLTRGWTPDRHRLDIAHVVYGAAIQHVMQKPPGDRYRYALMAWRLLDTAVQMSLTDLILTSAGALVKAGFGISAGPEMKDACKNVMLRAGRAGLSAFLVDQ